MSRAASEATEVAVTASIDHRITPIISPTTSNSAGIAMAISSVTRPFSSRDETECTANEIRQKVLNRAALEYDGEKTGKAGCRHRCDRVFGGCCAAVGVMGFQESECCCHAFRMRDTSAVRENVSPTC